MQHFNILCAGLKKSRPFAHTGGDDDSDSSRQPKSVLGHLSRRPGTTFAAVLCFKQVDGLVNLMFSSYFSSHFHFCEVSGDSHILHLKKRKKERKKERYIALAASIFTFFILSVAMGTCTTLDYLNKIQRSFFFVTCR